MVTTHRLRAAAVDFDGVRLLLLTVNEEFGPQFFLLVSGLHVPYLLLTFAEHGVFLDLVPQEPLGFPMLLPSVRLPFVITLAGIPSTHTGLPLPVAVPQELWWTLNLLPGFLPCLLCRAVVALPGGHWH